MNTSFKPFIVTLVSAFVLLGCTTDNSQPDASAEDATTLVSSLEDDCSKYRNAFASNNEFGILLKEYNAKFPFLNDYDFKEKLFVWDNSTGLIDEYDSASHEAEKSYLMGEGPIPKSLKKRITKLEPFTDAEKDWIAERVIWSNKIGLAQLSTTNSGETAAALWPEIQNDDLKEVLKDIAGLPMNDESGVKRARAFISADSICNFN